MKLFKNDKANCELTCKSISGNDKNYFEYFDFPSDTENVTCTCFTDLEEILVEKNGTFMPFENLSEKEKERYQQGINSVETFYIHKGFFDTRKDYEKKAKDIRYLSYEYNKSDDQNLTKELFVKTLPDEIKNYQDCMYFKLILEFLKDKPDLKEIEKTNKVREALQFSFDPLNVEVLTYLHYHKKSRKS